MLDTANSNILWDISLQAREKLNKCDYIKIKSFFTGKENLNKIKRQPTEWETILTDISDKDLIPNIY